MTTRREFVRTGVTLAAIPLASSVFTRQQVDGATARPLDRFVFDRRFAAAESAAVAAAERGVPLASFVGDLTDLWYHELDLAWRRAPETLAGVTSEHGLFVLETLAHDRAMRVVERQAGAVVGGERLVSWVIAPRAARASLA